MSRSELDPGQRSILPDGWRRFFRFPTGNQQLAEDLDAELHFHIEMRTEKLIEQGIEPHRARAMARERFGDPRAIRAACLEIDQRREQGRRLTTWLDELRQDLAYAWRALLRRPAFTAVALAMLVVGIGATTAIWSLLWRVVLRPLPLPEPERVVWTALEDPSRGTEGPLSPGLLLHWQESSRAVEAAAGLWSVTLTLDGDEGQFPERIEAARVTSDYFEVLGLPPRLGRVFGAGEDIAEGPPVVVLSDGLWRRRFDADPGIVGRRVGIDGEPHTVLGVLPASADIMGSRFALWTPLGLAPSQRDNLGSRYLSVLARLAPGAEVSLAAAELESLVRHLDLRARDDGELLIPRVVPLAELFYGDLRPRLLFLLFAVGSVLLIGCANLANLLLARGTLRARELGIRGALGAARTRLIRQLINESLLLGVMGAIGGVLLARLAVGALAARLPIEIPRLADVGVDLPVLGFAVGLGLLTSLVAGTLPALRATRLDLRASLATGGRVGGTGHGRRDPLRAGLVTAEVALALVLLAAATLFGRGLLRLQDVDPGFDGESVLTARVAVPRGDYPDIAAAAEVYERMARALEALPGAEAAAVISKVPFAGSGASLPFGLDSTSREPTESQIRMASPGSFGVLGIPLLHGRDLLSSDRRESEPVVVINRALAEELSEGSDFSGLIDRRIASPGGALSMAGEPIRWRIAGIVGNVREVDLRREARPTVYLAVDQAPRQPWEWTGRQMVLAVRTSVPPSSLIPTLRDSLAKVDSRLPIFEIGSLEQLRSESIATERLTLGLLIGLGLVGLVLAVGGIYGVVTYLVSQRTHEIGIRMALGATDSQVRGQVVRQGLFPVVLGLGIGILGALLAERAWIALIPDLPADAGRLDGLLLFGVGLALLSAAWLACHLPADAAARVDPARALGRE